VPQAATRSVRTTIVTTKAGFLPPGFVPESVVFSALKVATFLFTFSRDIYGPEGTTDLAAVAV
jgi:hypothetical protein